MCGTAGSECNSKDGVDAATKCAGSRVRCDVLAEIQGVNILNTKGQMHTPCVWDIYRMTWTKATCHEERKKSKIRMISWMGCARRPLQSLEGWKRGLVIM